MGYKEEKNVVFRVIVSDVKIDCVLLTVFWSISIRKCFNNLLDKIGIYSMKDISSSLLATIKSKS